MDPKNLSQANTPVQSTQNPQPAAEGTLHDEGIDIVGSGVAEENEFSDAPSDSPEASAASAAAAAELEKEMSPTQAPASASASAPAPAPVRDSANIIASLKEIHPGIVPPQRLAQQPAMQQSYSIPAVSVMPTAAAAAAEAARANQIGVAPATPVSSMLSQAPVQTPANAAVSAAAPIPKPINDPSIHQIRTFKSDAEEAVRYQNVSAVDIALAEQRKREKAQAGQPVPREHGHHAGIFIMAVIMILVVLGGGWYYWFSTSQPAETEATPAKTISFKPIISYTKVSTVPIPASSDPLVLVAAKLAQSNAGLGNVFALIPVTETNSSSPAPVSALFRETEMPDRLARSLAPEYMVGTYTYETQNPFIILKNTFFQNAFSGMLEWEKTVGTSLLPLIQVAHPEASFGSVSGAAFQDVIVSNTDARALKDSSGSTVLIYAFADQNTIIVTTGETALKYVLDRLLTVRTIQ